MVSELSSHVHASKELSVESQSKAKQEEMINPSEAIVVVEDDAVDGAAGRRPGGDGVNYVARAQWLRAAVLGANDGLVSVASLMIGVGAVNSSRRTMLVSGVAGLVAGACSMAIGEFVSVYAQYDIGAAQIDRARSGKDGGHGDGDGRGEEDLPSPTLAAVASALAFAVGAALPLLAGGFVRPWQARFAVVCAVSSLGLAGFGVVSAYLGGASMVRSGVRMLVGGWLAMATTYGVLKLFGMHAV